MRWMRAIPSFDSCRMALASNSRFDSAGVRGVRVGQLAQLVLDEAHVPGQRLDVRQHEGGGVVDLVRDAGGQQADRRQLLGLQAADLPLALVGRVADVEHARRARTAGRRAPRTRGRPASGCGRRSRCAGIASRPTSCSSASASCRTRRSPIALATFSAPSRASRQTPSSNTSNVSRSRSPLDDGRDASDASRLAGDTSTNGWPASAARTSAAGDRFDLLQLLLADAERLRRQAPVARRRYRRGVSAPCDPPSARRRPRSPAAGAARRGSSTSGAAPPAGASRWRAARPARPASPGRRRSRRPGCDRDRPPSPGRSARGSARRRRRAARGSRRSPAGPTSPASARP